MVFDLMQNTGKFINNSKTWTKGTNWGKKCSQKVSKKQFK